MNTVNTIFYTDDDSDDAQVFAEALKEVSKTEYHLEISEDGDQLLNSLHNPPPTPNIIFLDLNMPGKDGRQTLKEIHENEKLNCYPVVIFSTSSNKEDIDYTYKHGAKLFVNKPAKYVDLKKLLSQCLDIDWNNYKRPTLENYYLSAS